MVVPDYNPNVRDAELCGDHWPISIANLISSRAMRDSIFFLKKNTGSALRSPPKAQYFQEATNLLLNSTPAKH